MSELLYRTYVYDPINDKENVTYGGHRPLSESIRGMRDFCRRTNSFKNCMFIFKPEDPNLRNVYLDTRFKVISRNKFRELAKRARLKDLLGVST